MIGGKLKLKGSKKLESALKMKRKAETPIEVLREQVLVKEKIKEEKKKL